MPLKDPQKRKEYDLAYRKKWLLIPENKRKSYNYTSKARAKKVFLFEEYKKTLSCFHCGMKFDKNPECCDFHHVDYNRSLMKGRGFRTIASDLGFEFFKKCIENCIPLCANCHRILTKEEKQIKRDKIMKEV